MPETKSVDVSGIDKVQLLLSLWANTVDAKWCGDNSLCLGFNSNVARRQFAERDGYFDCFRGRVIKCQLKGDMVDPSAYDRYNGEGAFQKVINDIRQRDGISPVKPESSGGATEETATDGSSK